MNAQTQICTSCKEEKAFGEFHRRGNGFQRSCKVCRNMDARVKYASTGKKRTTTRTQIDKSNIAPLSERLPVIEKHLRTKARIYSHDLLEADDVYSKMVEGILTKSNLQDTDAMLLQRANWEAADHISKKNVYNLRVEPQEDELDVPVFESVEDIAIQNELSDEIKAAIDQLPDKHRKVVSLLSLGYTQREIAQKLQVTEPAISQLIKRIRVNMQSFGFSPA